MGLLRTDTCLFLHHGTCEVFWDCRCPISGSTVLAGGSGIYLASNHHDLSLYESHTGVIEAWTEKSRREGVYLIFQARGRQHIEFLEQSKIYYNF